MEAAVMRRLSGIEMAVRNELIEWKFYERIAHTTATVLGKSIFERLAMEKQTHYERLKEGLQKLKAFGICLNRFPDVHDRLTRATVQDIMERLILNEPDIYTIDENDLDNLRRSSVLAEKVVAFYRNLLNREPDPEIKRLFSLFADIEDKHRQFLEDTTEFLVQAGFVGKMDGSATFPANETRQDIKPSHQA
jgi:rubrerythrin